jgi:hypothetical protein
MNEQQIDELLDAVSSRQMSKSDAALQLQQAGVSAPSQLIDTHLQAVQLVQQFAVLDAIKNVRHSFEASNKQATPVVPIRKISARRWLSVAAAIIVLPALYISLQIATYSKQDMLSDLQTEFAVNTPRGENLNSIDSLLQSFNEQRFSDVVKHYKSLITPTVREQFLTGYAYQQIGNYNSSELILEKLLQQNKLQNETLYNDDAEYYLAMAAIELNQPAKAYTLLKAIHENEQHTYHEKVDRKLLWKLWWMK